MIVLLNFKLYFSIARLSHGAVEVELPRFVQRLRQADEAATANVVDDDSTSTFQNRFGINDGHGAGSEFSRPPAPVREIAVPPKRAIKIQITHR